MDKPTPTPAPSPPVTPTPTAPEPVYLNGLAIAGGRLVGARVNISKPSHAQVEETVVTDEDGHFRLLIPSEGQGDLRMYGGKDILTDLQYPYALVFPHVSQVPLVAGKDVVVSPISTLAFQTKKYVVASLESLLQRVATALDLWGLPGNGHSLAYYDPIEHALAAAASNQMTDLTNAAHNTLSVFYMMSVVSSTASLYSGVCGVSREVAGEWAFQSLAEIGPSYRKRLKLTDEASVRDIMTSDWMFGLCAAALVSDPGTAPARRSTGVAAEHRVILQEAATLVAKATVDLNRNLENSRETADWATYSIRDTLQVVATHSIVSQGVIANSAEALGKGEISASLFLETRTGEGIFGAIKDIELPAAVISAISSLEGHTPQPSAIPAPNVAAPTKIPIPVQEVTEKEDKFSAAKIVGLTIGPLLGVAMILMSVFLATAILKRRNHKVKTFNHETDEETGPIDSSEQTPGGDLNDAPGASGGADDSTYYKMPAPVPRSPMALALKDPLSPSGKAPGEYPDMDLVAQAKKVKEEKARQDFEAILKAQQDMMGKPDESESNAGVPAAPEAVEAAATSQPKAATEQEHAHEIPQGHHSAAKTS